MKKIVLSIALLVLTASPVFAAHNGKSHAPLKNIVVSVDGMVCDFCARALEKEFYKHENVESVVIDLDKKTMTLQIDEGTDVTDEDIKKSVYYAGYDVRNITR